MTTHNLSRRALLQRLLAPVSREAPADRPSPQPGGGGAGPPLLRPPGAIAEADFIERCTRCGECAKACPEAAIRSAPAQFGARSGTPWIDPFRTPCRLCEDLPCIRACEPAALDLALAGAMGTAHVRDMDCLNRLGSPCSACVEHCPVPGAIALVGSTPRVAEGLCVGCGTCAYVCPAPSKAILVLPRAARRQGPPEPTRPGPPPGPLPGPSAGAAPSVCELELSRTDLAEYLAELHAHAEILDVRTKRSSSARSSGGASIALPEVAQQLCSGALRGLQVLYRSDAEEYCDTLTRAPGGRIRLIRVSSRVPPNAG